jgi:hypothetical protein
VVSTRSSTRLTAPHPRIRPHAPFTALFIYSDEHPVYQTDRLRTFPCARATLYADSTKSTACRMALEALMRSPAVYTMSMGVLAPAQVTMLYDDTPSTDLPAQAQAATVQSEPGPARDESGPSLLSFAANDAYQMTWCCIQKLCTDSGEGQ